MLPIHYSPVRHLAVKYSKLYPVLVRLACVKHAASVHSEPGSNSPLSLNLTYLITFVTKLSLIVFYRRRILYSSFFVIYIQFIKITYLFLTYLLKNSNSTLFVFLTLPANLDGNYITFSIFCQYYFLSSFLNF